MSNGFYNYIAKNTINFFQSKRDFIRPGERYCLRLDTEEMAENVDQALQDYANRHGIEGKYVYSSDYTTFTIRLSNDLELVVASKINGMTDGFLTTLRNTQLTGKHFPILMITNSPIDSIVSGTGDLSSKGMPFHAPTLISRIREDIRSAQLSKVDELLLTDELNRKESDQFSDQSSLYEYNDLLTVLDRGYIKGEDYHFFGLLADPDSSGLVDSRRIKERIDLNHKIFNQIDRAVKHGNIEDDLEKEFDRDLINHLSRCKQDGTPWYEGQTLQMAIISKDKIKKKLDNPLEISDESLAVYSGSAIEYSFQIDKLVLMKDDGESGAKRRSKNILIYNPDHRAEVTVSMSANIAIRPNWIAGFGANVVSTARNITITMNAAGCCFSKTTITDATNKITYTIKICIIDIAPQYFETIRTSYLLMVHKNPRRCAIQALGIGKELLINPDQPKCGTAVLTDQGIYNCSFDHTLVLSLSEESMVPDSGMCSITLKCGAVSIPLQIKDESSKAKELTGVGVLRWKFQEDKHLEYRGERLIAGTAAFYTRKGPFQEALTLESWILNHEALAVDLTVNGPIQRHLQVSDAVRMTYITLIQKIKARNQLPSLVRYTGEVRTAAEAYVEAVSTEFAAIPSGESLETPQSDLLLIGCVLQTHDEHTIRMSPLHPLNVQYQLALLKEKDVGEARDQILEKLTPLNLIPYVRDQERRLYHAVEQKHSPEWRFYAQVSNKRYQGARNFVQRLVCNKITHYKNNFSFLFEDICNRKFQINLVNMGDCKEVLQGLIRYYRQQLNDHIPLEKLDQFVVNIYGARSTYNEFSVLGNQQKLREFIQNYGYDLNNVSEMALILAGNIKCYFRNPNNEKYEYAHLTFYEMDSSHDFVTGRMENIPTGASLGGLTSGIPSVLDGSWYKTGFGARFSPKNELMKMALHYNALYHVAFSGSTYDPAVCTFTEIEKGQENQLAKIYQTSNWVVFVSPKVDLSFFQKKDLDDNELMIIHYSDQYTSTNGYDDITVTQKSKQYREIIYEQLQKKNVTANPSDIDGVINMFNAINGSWMLKLISAKKLAGAADSYFSREKMSILSAIKVCMAYYAHDGIIWVPISLEEILRVSGAAGLSQSDGLLSGKNLGFSMGPTCDDILLVGLEEVSGKVKIYLHPIEVKIGQNISVYGKAKQQVLNTYDGLWNALWPDKDRDTLEIKVTRNFFLQLVLVCCEKMKLYGIDPTVPWKFILEDNREALLNEDYTFSRDLDAYIGKGTIVSFKTDAFTPSESEEDNVVLLEFPEDLGAKYIVKPVSEIKNLLRDFDLPCRLKEYCKPNVDYDTKVSFDSELVIQSFEESIAAESSSNIISETATSCINNESTISDALPVSPIEQTIAPAVSACGSMSILFGTDLGTGQPLYWLPNDTNQVFHTNTGIIGTMGTGKTQFTKSIIAQLYRDQSHNFRGRPLGILIFDYKGDYNESKTDFVQMTNACILKPYHLPFNPLALTKSKVFRPLLPVHAANAFKDTLSKVYGLGPKQQNSLFSCITEAYNSRGIYANMPDTWDYTPPTFESVYNIYIGNDEIKKTDSLAAVMDKLHQFQVFECDPEKTISLFELLNGVVVIDLSGYDSDIQSLIVAITLDLFYAQMQAAGSSQMDHQYRELTKLILVDEADNFMSEGYPSLKKILKEGREFGVGTILSTQFLKHFGSGEDDYSKYILTWVVHNVADLKPSDIEFVFRTESKSSETLKIFNDIKGLLQHHSIIKIGNTPPRYVRDKAFWELYQELG